MGQSELAIDMEVENGRAVIELTLPDLPNKEQHSFYEVYLWEEGRMSAAQDTDGKRQGMLPVIRQPAFYCAYPANEDDSCVIKLLRPHLWQGVENPYLYCLEVYLLSGSDRRGASGAQCHGERLCSRSIGVRSVKEIPGRGYFLNERTFVPKGVFYGEICHICDKGSTFFREDLMQKLQVLAQMGANVLTLGSVDGMSEQECIILQECCDRVGFILHVGHQTGDSCSSHDISQSCKNNDTCVLGETLFDGKGFPTDSYYRCRADWSREPFVYISAKSLQRHPDGGYEIKVYSSCKKVTLMVDGKVFGVQEGGGEFLFQDIQMKGFPVNITAQTENCSMTIRSYGLLEKLMG